MKILTIALAAAVWVLVGLAFVHRTAQPQPSLGAQNIPALSVATTSTSVAVTVSARLLATTTSAEVANSYQRAYATICNPNTNPVYLLLDGDKPASKTKATYVIAAAAGYDACFRLTDIVYNGSITASSTNETSTIVTVSSYVY